MTPAAAPLRALFRLVAAMVCVAAATFGFAAGSHSATHLLAGSTQPGHHAGGGAGHAPQTTDDGTQARTLRRIRGQVVRRRPRRLRASWVGLRSMMRHGLRVAVSPAPSYARPDDLAAWSSPTRLCVCRT